MKLPVIEDGIEEPPGGQESLQVNHEHEEVFAVGHRVVRPVLRPVRRVHLVRLVRLLVSLVQDVQEFVDQCSQKHAFSLQDLKDVTFC